MFVDKMRKLYGVNKHTYEKLLTENITKTYKKSNLAAYNEINGQTKNIATELGIANRVEGLTQTQAFHYTERP